MADNQANKDKDSKDSAQNELLASLSRIYAFVKSRATTKSFSGFSFDDYIQQAKDEIKSDTKKSTRPTKLERLSKLEDEISKTIRKARDLKEDNDKPDT